MKLRILGCGTSAGVPRVGNDWGECDPAEPRNRRSRAAILVESAGMRLLVDCGPDLRQQLLDAGTGEVDAVIVTHDHADHCHGIDELRPIAQRRKLPIPLHARENVLDRLRSRFGYAFAGSGFYTAVAEPHAVGDALDFGNATIRFVDQPHGAITSLGMRIEEGERAAVYAIDFHEMTPAMADLYAGADLMISDCLQRRPHPTHAHLDAVLGWARELGVGQLLLSHMNGTLDYAALAAELPDWAAPAHDGQEVVLA